MLIELRAKNCFSFSEKIVFSAKADMRNKNFVIYLIPWEQRRLQHWQVILLKE